MARPGLRPVRRRLRLHWPRLLATLALLAVLVGLWQLERSPLLRLQHIVVRGGSERLVALSGLRLDEPLWSVDVAAVSRSLLRRAPYLKTALVRRQWPQTMEIQVSDRVPIAAVAGAGGAFYGVDQTGRVLAPLASAQGLTVLGGVPPGLVGRYRDLGGGGVHAALALIAGLQGERFQVSQVVAGSPIEVYLPSGTEVLWPQGTNLAATLRELQAIVKALQARGAVAASIDLRVADRPLVVLRR